MPCNCAGGMGLGSPAMQMPIGGGAPMTPIWAGGCTAWSSGACGTGICAYVGHNLPFADNPCFYTPANGDQQTGQPRVACVAPVGP
jgi:hypothetical protein